MDPQAGPERAMVYRPNIAYDAASRPTFYIRSNPNSPRTVAANPIIREQLLGPYAQGPRDDSNKAERTGKRGQSAAERARRTRQFLEQKWDERRRRTRLLLTIAQLTVAYSAANASKDEKRREEIRDKLKQTWQLYVTNRLWEAGK